MQQKIGTSHSMIFERLCTGRVRGLSVVRLAAHVAKG